MGTMARAGSRVAWLFALVPGITRTGGTEDIGVAPHIGVAVFTGARDGGMGMAMPVASIITEAIPAASPVVDIVAVFTAVDGGKRFFPSH